MLTIQKVSRSGVDGDAVAATIYSALRQIGHTFDRDPDVTGQTSVKMA
jgi:hypothetical protein